MFALDWFPLVHSYFHGSVPSSSPTVCTKRREEKEGRLQRIGTYREEPTNHDIGLSSGLLDDRYVVERAVDELRVGVPGLDRPAALLVAHEEGVVVVGVLLLENVEDVAANVAWWGRS